ncbi:MAG: fumarylacetoacetate hydrolase family protein [Firmicutes bacterium]|nr:fumarylacetoacetate hydrolase family protein [Bacillota bacterium]
MKLFTYINDNGNQKLASGYTNSNDLLPLEKIGLAFDNMLSLIEASAENNSLLSEINKAVSEAPPADCIKIANVKLCSPIPNPKQDIICLGINYMEHAEESARYKKEAFGGERPYAVYFSKRACSTVGNGDIIPAYENLVDSLDYEAELAVIVGKKAKNIPENDAQKYIFGYTILNDVSARNLQTRHKQWYFGKSLDGFAPVGPCILTADEIPFPPELSIQSYVNGELRQDSNTNMMIFGISHVISELSQGMTLLPGSIIAMGTPAGVGMGFTPPKFLKPGDTVRCTIERIGDLINSVK